MPHPTHTDSPSKQPRYRRRKEDRPEEIADAALQVFSEKGYSATKVEEVAQRAGVSKGLLYLYYKTKQDLFKTVVRKYIAPKVDHLLDIVETTDLPAEEFLRGPFLHLAKQIPHTPASILIRLMITEGHRHPDLVAYYWETVVSHGILALKTIIRRGVASGEFRETAIEKFPQLIASPVIFSVIWNSIFSKQEKIDSDPFIETHIDMLIAWLKA